MPTSNLVDIGIFREDFFIDMVDHEYCLRARKLGFLVMITRKPLMRHSLNSPTTMSLLGKELTLTNSAVFRRYFIARNCLLTAREYWRTDFLYILRTTFGATLIALLLKIPLEKEHRKAKMAAVLQGIADGLRNRSGAGTRALPR
jgi:rhamnosyltransferase